METICRAILVYCLLHYRGDESIKAFIWDLISPNENGKAKELQNHSGEAVGATWGHMGTLHGVWGGSVVDIPSLFLTPPPYRAVHPGPSG